MPEVPVSVVLVRLAGLGRRGPVVGKARSAGEWCRYAVSLGGLEPGQNHGCIVLQGEFAHAAVECHHGAVGLFCEGKQVGVGELPIISNCPQRAIVARHQGCVVAPGLVAGHRARRTISAVIWAVSPRTSKVGNPSAMTGSTTESPRFAIFDSATPSEICCGVARVRAASRTESSISTVVRITTSQRHDGNGNR